jgi:hypothetical protein
VSPRLLIRCAMVFLEYGFSTKDQDRDDQGEEGDLPE